MRERESAAAAGMEDVRSAKKGALHFWDLYRTAGREIEGIMLKTAIARVTQVTRSQSEDVSSTV